jgi:hypothetical protein
MSDHNDHNNHDDEDKKNLQAQLEAQAQAQAELQAQLQGQGQGQHQSQESENYNKNFNADVNLNGNANLNANVNLNKTEVCVDVKVNADVSASGETDSHTYGIDMGYLSINVSELDGILNLSPEIINQTINGGGAGTNVLFNLDQVNNLVDNDKLENVQNSNSSSSISFSDIKGEGGDISIGCCPDDKQHDGGPHITGLDGIGGHGGDDSSGVQIGSGNGAGSTNSTLVDASGNVSIDALTQSIVLGANIQTNSFNMNNAGHDITVVDHGSSHDGNHNG